ncbi:DUF4157 domain-containing protein [Nitrosovibrio sp. Nv6]|uniref:eCIS core domain-containing protein n=1 Tax=Nitrosovibrio sp. Nv6 TaxID=1855340 RepID=UPI002100E5CF|nr:DUF4157 domain-containing protein [Nitrosovibrio sp. Nv6]
MARPTHSGVSDAPLRIQRYSGQTTESPNTAPASVDRVLSSSGRSLEPVLRQDMEQRFGHDFSQVGVQTGDAAEQSAREVNAAAYTVGHNIVFGRGQFAPGTEKGRRLIAHELTHVVQQSAGSSPRIQRNGMGELRLSERCEELKGEIRVTKAYGALDMAAQSLTESIMIEVDKNSPSERYRLLLTLKTLFVDPAKAPSDLFNELQQFLRSPTNQPASKEEKKCEQFPGGSTDCVVDEKTGTPTGKVTQRIEETNRCTRPCVEQHEAVHVKQLKAFCPKLRDCYLAADAGKRPVEECIKMNFVMKELECEAYKVSVQCLEKRLKAAKECQSKENKEYGTRQLASDKCFRDKNCGDSNKK